MHIIAGSLKNKSISVPKGSFVRPTSSMVRESVFNICQNFIEKADFLDLFAGSGAMGLEALSRGAASSTFVDRQKEAIKTIEKNLEVFELKAKGMTVLGDVIQVIPKLKKLNKAFDIIYIDPPYGLELSESDQKISYSLQLLKLIDETQLLKNEGHLFIEDIKNALDKAYTPSHLKLLNHRKMGRTNLFHYKNESRA